ncbi:MAG: NAD(P)-dependent oxidoreductase [Waddliaceae bacterium]
MNSFKGCNVFVSGGAGVIGTVLIDRLQRDEANIFVGDLKPKPPDWQEGILYRQGDLNTITKEELLAYEPHYFFHLAATFERSVESYGFWRENFYHNVQLSHHLIDCLKDCPSLQRVVFASSYLVYHASLYQFEIPPRFPVRLDESKPVSPRNLCGAAKLYHEHELFFLQSFEEASFTAISARIFRSYGKGSRDVISRWIRALLKNERLKVYNCEGCFDLIFAEDAAEGLCRLALSDAAGAVNLGTGCARKISDVLNILNEHFHDAVYETVKTKIHFEASQANMDNFKTITGWVPGYQLEDAIPLIIDYEKKRPPG